MRFEVVAFCFSFVPFFGWDYLTFSGCLRDLAGFVGCNGVHYVSLWIDSLFTSLLVFTVYSGLLVCFFV